MPTRIDKLARHLGTMIEKYMEAQGIEAPYVLVLHDASSGEIGTAHLHSNAANTDEALQFLRLVANAYNDDGKREVTQDDHSSDRGEE